MTQCELSEENCPTIQLLENGKIKAFQDCFEFYWVTKKEKEE